MANLRIDYDSVAEIYDLYVTAHYDIPFFLAETANVKEPVLELTAGTGRLSLPLVQAGVRLTCVDASRGMLNVLSRKLRESNLYADVRCADVCHLQLPTSFQLAILPFQSFMEIVGEERQRQALSAVFACLAPGGRFICTLHNPAVRRAQVDGVLRVVGRFPTPDGALVVSGFEQGGRPVVTRLQFFEFFGNDGLLRSKQLLPMEFELVERERFESMAREAGFHVLELYGNYDRSPFDAVRSPVMIWVLQKGDAPPPVAVDIGSAPLKRDEKVPALPPKSVVEAWVDAFNRADVEGLVSLYAEKAINHQVAEAPVEGREAIRERFAGEFETAKMTCIVENLFEDGEWAILEWRDPLGLRGCGFFHVIDGKIHFQRGYWDKLTFLRQHGLPLPTE